MIEIIAVNTKYSMFCFSEVLRKCSKLTYVVVSTAAKEQIRYILICFQNPWISSRFLCNNPEEGARDTKTPLETGWEDSLW